MNKEQIYNYNTTTDFKKLRPISAINNKQGIKNYPELLNQKSTLKPYLSKNSFNNNHSSIVTNNKAKNLSNAKKVSKIQSTSNANTNINIINNINNISTLNYNQNMNNTHYTNNMNNMSNSNSNSNCINPNNSQIIFNPTGFNSSVSKGLGSGITSSSIKNRLQQTTPLSNVMPFNDFEKIYEECNMLRNTNNQQAKEITDLKSEIQRKEAEIIKNNKLYSKFLFNQEANNFGSLNNYNYANEGLLPSINSNKVSLYEGKGVLTNLTNIENIQKIKESNLVHNLREQYKEAKQEIKSKNTQIDELKKTIKYTRIQEIAAENLILKEELRKCRNGIIELEKNNKQQEYLKKENAKLISINSKLNSEISSLSVNIGKIEDYYSKLVSSKDDEIKKLTSDKMSNKINNGNVSNNNNNGFNLGNFDIRNSTHQNYLLDVIKQIFVNTNESPHKNINIKKPNNSSNSKELNTIKTKIFEIVNSNLNNKLQELEKQAISKNNQVKENTNNNNCKETKGFKLTEISAKERENILSKASNARKGKKIPKLFYSSKTEVNNDEFLEKMAEFNEENDNNKLKNENKKTKENKNNNTKENSEKAKKQKSLSEEEVNEYTYILIKNLEVLSLAPEQLEEVLFDYEVEAPNALNNLYNRLLSLLCVTERKEKDKLQSYLLTLSSICGGDFSDVKEKFMVFFEAINIYSQEQIELYEEKLKKKLKPLESKLKQEFQSFDKENTGIISFEEFRIVLQNSEIELKESYIEYLIYKMKCAVAEEEERIVKIELLNYMPLFDLLIGIEKENCNNNNVNLDKQENDESSLNEEDLKEGIENINFFNMRHSAVLEDIKPCKDNYDEEYMDALNSNMSNNAEEALNKAIILDSKPSKTNTGSVSAIATASNKFAIEDPVNNILGNSNIDTAKLSSTLTKNEKIDSNKNDKVNNSNIISDDKFNDKENDEDLEISISEFNDRNEKVFYRIAQYLFQNKIKVSQMFDKLLNDDSIKIVISNNNEKYIVETEAFFTTLEKIGISLDTIDQYCILMKLTYDDSNEEKAVNNEIQGNYIDIQKLKEEMTNYGVFDDATLESVVNLDNKKFTNKFYAERSESFGNSNRLNFKNNTTSSKEYNDIKEENLKVEDKAISNNSRDKYLKIDQSPMISKEYNKKTNANDKTDDLLEKTSLFDNMNSSLNESKMEKDEKNEKDKDKLNSLLNEKKHEKSSNYDLELNEIEDNNAFDDNLDS